MKNYGDNAFAVALLKAVNPKLTDCQIADEYEEFFLSNDMPGFKLGRTAVSTFIKSVGKDNAKVLKFMNNRVEKIDEGNRIAIDGMLSVNNSRINSLCDFSFKSKIKSTKRISQIIAFNVTTKEIICSIPYSGNTSEKQNRNIKDRPILRVALKAKVDILLTGDKDFLESNVKTLIIMTPSEFLDAINSLK